MTGAVVLGHARRALLALLVLWALGAWGWRWAVTTWACYLLTTWCRLVVIPDLRVSWGVHRAIRHHPSARRG